MIQVMGIKYIWDGIEVQFVIGVDMVVIGIVGIVFNVNSVLVFLNRFLFIFSNDSDIWVVLGIMGIFVDVIDGIFEQLKDVVKIVFVCIVYNVDVFIVIINILGFEVSCIGMWVFFDVFEDLGIILCFFIVFGYILQIEIGVDVIMVSNGGFGYIVDFVVIVIGGGGIGFVGIVFVVDGVIQLICIDNFGKGYFFVFILVFLVGVGIGGVVIVIVGDCVNQVCQSIFVVVDWLWVCFILEGLIGSCMLVLKWLESMLCLVVIFYFFCQDVKVIVVGFVVMKLFLFYIVVFYVKCDVVYDGILFYFIVNMLINGFVGVFFKILFDIILDGFIGMMDIENYFGIVVCGEIGVDGFFFDGGYIFWGIDIFSDDSQWFFVNVGWFCDYVEINQIKVMWYYFGNFNIIIQVV